VGQVAFAQLSSTITQRPNRKGIFAINMENWDAIHGIDFDPRKNKTDIKIIHDGTYFIMAAPQVGRMHKTNNPTTVNFFISINNKALDNSNVSLCFPAGDNTPKDVIVSQGIVTLKKGDVVKVMMSILDDNSGSGIESIYPKDEPAVPAIIFSMFRLGAIS
jgi:hypothetical protein